MDEKLGLDPASGIVLGIGLGTTEQINLVEENYGGFALAREFKQILDESLALWKPPTDQVRRGDGEEGGVCFRGNCLG